MADIRVERTGGAWVWWTVAILALALLLAWAFSAGYLDDSVYNTERHDSVYGSVRLDTGGPSVDDAAG